jgi:putative phosphotransacetylase
MIIKVKIGISNRHVHLTEETYNKLFNEKIDLYKNLNQVGEFASNKKVTLKTDKFEIPNVRVLGPFRKYNQIEISRSDAIKLGLNPPVANSGDLLQAEEITLVTDKTSIKVKGCILAHRHVHMTPDEALKYGVKNYQPVKLIVNGNKGGVLNANVKISDNGYYEAHIDTDEAAAFGLNNGDEVELEI